MQARFQKLNFLNTSIALSINTRHYPYLLNFFRFMGLEFGHFSLKHLLREHWVLAFTVAAQKPVLRLVRHIYKKHLRVSARLVTFISSQRWFILEHIVMRMFGAMDFLRTLKQRRRNKNKLDLRIRQSFKTPEIKPIYDPEIDEIFLPFNIALKFNHGFRRLNYRFTMNYLRMLKVPILLFRLVKPRIQHEEKIISLPYNT